MESLMNMQSQIPSYTPFGPTGFGKDILFGSMGRTTEPMRSSINVSNNSRSINGGALRRRHQHLLKRALHTEGSGFFDTLLDIGKKILPTIGSFMANSPVAQIFKSILPKVPGILEKAGEDPDLDPLLKQLIEITKDPEIRSLIRELTGRSGSETTTNYF